MLTPEQRGNGLRFHSRHYQRAYMGAYAREEYRRYYRVWSRRGGKDDCGWCARIQKIIRHEQQGIARNYWLVFPEFEQGRRAFWDNICGHNMRMVEHVPPAWRAGRHWLDEGKMQVHFRGGSIFQVLGARFPNKLRGPNPHDVEFSEWSQCNPGAWDVVRPILIVNRGVAGFNTTPFGRNHAHQMWRRVHGAAGWFTDMRSADRMFRDAPGEDGGPLITQADLDEMRREGVDEDFIQQEYFCSWAGVMTGAYFGALIEQARREERVTYVPHVPELPVHTVWDRGDSNAIWFMQLVGRRVHFIDYLETNGLALPEILDQLRHGHRAAYKYGAWFAGKDMFESNDYFTTGLTSFELAKSVYNIEFQMAPKLSLLDGIEAGRQLIKRAWFDEARCATGLDALSSYHRKWLEDRKAFSLKPVHDWASHGADAMRYAGVSLALIEQWQASHSLEGVVLPQSTVTLPRLPLGASSDNSWMGN